MKRQRVRKGRSARSTRSCQIRGPSTAAGGRVHRECRSTDPQAVFEVVEPDCGSERLSRPAELDQVQPALALFCLATVVADPVNDQAVARHPKLILTSDGLTNLDHFVAMELD